MRAAGKPLHAAMYLQVRDGRITRIEEYLDSGQRARIKAARAGDARGGAWHQLAVSRLLQLTASMEHRCRSGDIDGASMPLPEAGWGRRE
jgi:hypothetical protein